MLLFDQFDHGILRSLNGHVGQWPALDAIIVMIQLNPLLKGVPLVLPLIFAWFSTLGNDDERLRRRQIVVAGLAAMVTALAVARIIANCTPYRVRPILDASLNLRLPGGLTTEAGSLWSAFPSDHAAVWFALAATIWLLYRRWGWLALLLAAVLGVLRVYVAFHSPSDIIVGGLIGVTMVLVMSRESVRTLLHALANQIAERSPGLFHCGLVLIVYQVSTMFTETRWLARLMASLLSGDAVTFPET